MADPRSPMYDWIAQLFRDENMLRMGHGQRVEDRNLGFGWVYYALARLLRPERVVVIGSYRGFAPLGFGKALHDSVAMNVSPVYGPDRAYTCTVRRFMDRLKQRPEFQVFDLPFGPGLTLVRRAELPPA